MKKLLLICCLLGIYVNGFSDNCIIFTNIKLSNSSIDASTPRLTMNFQSSSGKITFITDNYTNFYLTF